MTQLTSVSIWTILELVVKDYFTSFDLLENGVLDWDCDLIISLSLASLFSLPQTTCTSILKTGDDQERITSLCEVEVPEKSVGL